MVWMVVPLKIILCSSGFLFFSLGLVIFRTPLFLDEESLCRISKILNQLIFRILHMWYYYVVVIEIV